jgi:hypothetical protein
MSHFLSKRLWMFFDSFSMKKIYQLHLLENICSYLDPWPELAALTYAIPVATRYRKRHVPSWIDIPALGNRVTLYLTFGMFDGQMYLTSINNHRPAGKARKMVIQNQLLICRDHFAIVDIYGSSDQVDGHRWKNQDLFYHTIHLQDIGSQPSRCQAFSDVCVKSTQSSAVPNPAS